MFCEHCGKQVEDGSAFCEHCGAKFETATAPAAEASAAPVAAAAPAAPKAPPAFLTKMKNFFVGIHKKNKFILPACGLGLVAIIVGIIFLVGFLSQVPMQDFTKIEATGYEGFSEFTCDLDETSIMLRALGYDECEEYGDYKYFDESEVEKVYAKMNSKNQKKALEQLADSLKIEYTFPEGRDEYTLRNGDKIEITLTCDEDAAKELDFPLKGSTFTYEVTGLKSVDLFDVISYFTIEYTGADGYATAQMVCNKTEDVTKGDYTFSFTEGNRYFTIDGKNGYETDIYLYVEYGDNESLSNDDEVTITMNYVDNETFLEQGFAVSPSKKTVKVSGLTAPQEFDLLQYYTLTYSGINGDGYIDRLVPSQEEVTIGDLRIDLESHELYLKDNYVAYYSFNYSPNYDLSNGDEVTVTINYNEEYFAKAGIILTATEKTVTAEGIYEYVDELSDLAPIMEDLTASAKETLVEKLDNSWNSFIHNTYFGSFSDKKYSDPVLYKTILATNPTSYTSNYVWFVFSSTISDSEITTPTTYYFAVYDDNFAYSTTREALRYDPSFYAYFSDTNYDELQTRIADYGGELEVK